MLDKSDRELLEAINLTVVSLAKDVSQACKDVTTINRTLFGNHKVGMVEDYAVTKTKVSLILWVGGAVTLSVIGLLVTSIWQLVTKAN